MHLGVYDVMHLAEAEFGLRVSRDIAWRWLETCGASAASLAKSEVSAESPPCSSDVSSRSCSEQPAGRFGALPAATEQAESTDSTTGSHYRQLKLR